MADSEMVRFHVVAVPTPTETNAIASTSSSPTHAKALSELNKNTSEENERKAGFDYDIETGMMARGGGKEASHTSEKGLASRLASPNAPFGDNADLKDRCVMYGERTSAARRRYEGEALKPLQEPVVPNPRALSTSSPYLPYFLQWPLFWFPFNINTTVARFVAAQVVGICILVIICREHRWAWYVTIGLFANFVAQFFFGGRGSLIGVVAEIITEVFHIKHHWYPGNSKQLAAFCGLLFSGGAALCFFLSDDSNGVGGAVIMGALMGAAFLEGAFDICVACIAFSILAKFGILSNTGFERSSATLEEMEETRRYLDTRLDLPRSDLHKNFVEATSTAPRQLLYAYKPSTDQDKKDNFNLIRNIKSSYFAFPIGITGLAIQWNVSSRVSVFGHIYSIWFSLAIAGGIIYGIFLLLYFAKCVLYPRKVVKEWYHPVYKYTLFMIPLNLLLFVPLAYEYQFVLARVLYWISAPLILVMTVLTLSSWVLHPVDMDNFHPGWSLSVLSNIVAAFCLPLVYPQFTNASWLWMSISIFFWVILTTMSVIRLTFYTPLDDKIRPMLFLLVAAPNLLFCGYVNINGGQSDNFAEFLYYVGLILFLWCGWLGLHAYFGRQRFGMDYWAFAFPLDTMAIATSYHHSIHHTDTTNGIASTAIVITNGVISVFFAHTILALIQRVIFVPDDKWAPQSAFKVQHYAFRYALHRMVDLTNRGLTKESEIAELKSLFSVFHLTLKEHALVEEHVIYPLLHAWFQGITRIVDDDHDREMSIIDAMLRRIQALPDRSDSMDEKNYEVLINKLNEDIKELTKDLEKHMDNEEIDLAPAVRKYLNIPLHKELVRRAWDFTPLPAWREIIPFTLENQFIHQRRVRFLQALRWAIPDKMHLVGKMVYEGVKDPFLFERLCVDIPELAPRNTPTYVRYW